MLTIYRRCSNKTFFYTKLFSNLSKPLQKLFTAMQNFASNHSSIFNILLIGKNDYLKSLTLNALTNYLKHPPDHDWEKEAIKLIDIIPMNVNFFDKKSRKSKSIDFGKTVEAVSTATLKCHLLIKSSGYSRYVIRIIEVPENDPKSQIIKIHKLCGTLHGILYLITGDHTDFFINKFKPCLSALTQSAVKNVVFCFTFNQQPDYNIEEIKRQFNSELVPFKIQLSEGTNCFEINCEPFQQVLENERGFYKFLKRDRNSWEEAQANAKTILGRISTKWPCIIYNLEEYSIAENSKYFFDIIEKSATNLEVMINEKEEGIVLEAKRFENYKNKNRNTNLYKTILTEIESNHDEIRECLKERNELKKCTQEFVKFIFSKLNQNVKKFITPFILQFLSSGKTENKKTKTKLKPGEDGSDGKLKNLIDSIKITKNIEPEEIINSLTKLSLLKISGKYFNKNFTYFQTKNFNPSLKPILDLVGRVFSKIVHLEMCLDVFRKSMSGIENSDKFKIRIVCFKSILNQKFCHVECECEEKDIVLNVEGHPSMQKCKTIDAGSKQCTKCNYSWTEHQHKTTKDVEVFLKNAIELYKDECNVIKHVSAKFDYLLMKHSQKCLSDYMDQYLSNQSKDSLNKLKNEHWQNVLKLIESNEKVELTDIPELCDELYQLKRSGKYFKPVKQDANMTNSNAIPGIVQQKPTCSTSSNSENTSNI